MYQYIDLLMRNKGIYFCSILLLSKLNLVFNCILFTASSTCFSILYVIHKFPHIFSPYHSYNSSHHVICSPKVPKCLNISSSHCHFIISIFLLSKSTAMSYLISQNADQSWSSFLERFLEILFGPFIVADIFLSAYYIKLVLPVFFHRRAFLKGYFV